MTHFIIVPVMAALDRICSVITEAHLSHIHSMHILTSFSACLGMFMATSK